MKTNQLIRVAGCMTAVCLAVSLSAAQEKIDDSDLMRMLESANGNVPQESVQPETAPAADNPIEQAEAAAEQAGERAAEADAAMEDPVVEEPVEESVEPVVQEPAAEETVAASEEDAPAAAETDIPEATAGEEEMLDDLAMTSYDEATASSNDELISVRLNKVGLEEAINLFAQLSGANIIVPELTEAAQISVNLKDVEWRPALQSILDSYNYELYQKVSGSNVYSVRRRPAGAPEPQVVETFILRYATVPNAAALVRELLPPEAKISEFASRNMLVVKSTESSLGEVRTVLQTIDTIRQQVFIESKFMELNDRAQKDLGIDWQVLQAYSIGTEGKTERRYTETETENTERNSFTDALGRPYAEGNSFVDGATLDGNFPVYEGLTPLVQAASTDGSTEVLTSVLNADEFRVVLSALEDNKGVNVVSNPKIIVANEEKANIAIVRKEPNLKQERQQTAGAQGGAAIDNIVFELDPELPFFEYGIKLDVTPSINTTSNITVRINPSLTRFVEDKPAGDNTYPIIDEKSIDTVFNLASGQTAAIGGLTEVTDSEFERKIPLLGDIPLIGRYLFSWNQTVSEQTETIIFVTVGLANTQAIGLEDSLPADAELARRRLIRDENKRILRNQGRDIFRAEESDRLNEKLNELEEKEARRQQKRDGGQESAPNNVALND